MDNTQELSINQPAIDNTNAVARVSYSFEGEQQFIDRYGNIVTDENEIDRFRKRKGFRQEVARAKEAMSKEVAALIAKDDETRRAYSMWHRDSPPVLSSIDFQNALGELSLTELESIPYEEPEPTREQVEQLLILEALQKVRTINIFRIRKLRNEYVEQHLEERFADAISAWEERRNAYIAEESRIVAEENLARKTQYEEMHVQLEAALSGDKQYVDDTVATWAKDCDLPIDVSFSGSFDADTNTETLEVMLPCIDAIPSTYLTQLKNGSGRKKQLSKAALNDLYANCTFSLLIFLVSNIFNVSPAINVVITNAYAEQKKAFGITTTECILTARFTRDQLRSVYFETINPRTYLEEIGASFALRSNCSFKSVTPFRVERGQQ
ncbi:MAG: hypothetical protein IKG21_11150 [Atopobiaceae bacterium]|nr:hypothetical protein [Atopobiaceae bacterium]